MPTLYSDRAMNPLQMSVAQSNSLRQFKSTRKVPAGYVLLYQNSNYSNTTRQCAYLCDKTKVQWNGKVAAHNAVAQ
jgi:hypothetical protein